MHIKLKRIYDDANPADGYRILVDRLWPRGVSKDSAKLDEWLKDVGPSDELRKWFNHDPEKFPEFAKKYQKELAENPAFEQLQQIAQNHKTVTLVYSAKDAEHNQAVVLKSYLIR
jgi:uncharacterized protein YeaO (DUF488 family)